MPDSGSALDLGTLADRLIVRHLRVSIPDPIRRQELQEGRRPEVLLEQRVRCIAIVGAGASAPLLQRGDALALGLEKEFASDEVSRGAELSRLERVYGLDPTHFETRLAALSRTPEVAQAVRQHIAQHYAYRHPTILGYELLAHLLKHRFLDAIISFNFDELLDQSLDDELGSDEYRCLVSDRDAVGTVTDPDEPDYLPLYVKLHGTATEPDTLRFTRESYYELPKKLMGVVEELFESQLCVIVNIGSAMTGFDLHRLLRIPHRLEIHDLSYKPVTPKVQKEIRTERRAPRADSFAATEERDDPTFALPKAKEADSNGWLRSLVGQIAAHTDSHADPRSINSIVNFRSVDRHEAIAEVLGPAAALKSWIRSPTKYRRDYIEYLRQRTILELAFSGAKARGLAQLSWMAVDRCGTYYEMYRRKARETRDQAESWNELRAAAGLVEASELPDVVQAKLELCVPSGEPVTGRKEFLLREFVPKQLSAHVALRIGIADQTAVDRLAKTIGELQGGSEVEIQPTDDRVCSKAFNAPLTLPTITSLRTFTLGLFRGIQPQDKVYIICETGEWLIEDEQMYDVLSKQEHVRVITAFKGKYADLYKRYGDRLKMSFIDPWRHNRHMTIVCRGNNPWRGVYFARRQRTPLITPVYLNEAEDAARLKRSFDLMYRQAKNSRRP
ncbi:SIR2 family protein [Baekduia sp.]|jgi:hypothetical protein|uniref:SIR2 family protein n=1 Tax=Baekduia sp. TaxID=2600305 RepID=UPI002E0B5926|nr:SIR2 family protein [Baekduia sp.]